MRKPYQRSLRNVSLILNRDLERRDVQNEIFKETSNDIFMAITIAGCSAIEPDPMGQSEELAKEPLASQSLLLQKEPKVQAENKPSKPSREELLAALYRGERLINFPRLSLGLRDNLRFRFVHQTNPSLKTNRSC